MTTTSVTDIVIGVAQAADPQRLASARQRLLDRSAPAAPQAMNFAGMVAKGNSERSRPSAIASKYTIPITTRNQNDNVLREGSGAAKVGQKFEAFILQSMIETILPKEGGAIFGGGAGAGVWRSMLAEQLANQIAKSGGVGLQKVISVRMRTQGVGRSTG